MSATLATSRQRPDARPHAITRAALFGTLGAIGFFNGVSERVFQSASGNGLSIAAFSSFDVSIVVWAAGTLALWKILRSPVRPATGMDTVVAGLAALCFLAPVPALSWFGLAAMSAYLLASTARADAMRDGAVLLAAATVPMLWAPLLLAIFSNAILSVDAKVISWVVGTSSVGNIVPFADGSGVLFIAPACSSLANLSITLLCGIVFMKACELRWTRKAISTIALACAATVAVNVLRISAIGVLPGYYDQIHGFTGALVAQWATTLLVLVIYVERFRPVDG